MSARFEQTQTLSILDVENGTAESSCSISTLRAGKPLVLDLWHTRCTRCPDALTKLDAVAASGKHQGVVFAACALSLCDKPDGPESEDAGREAVTELIDDMWDNLKHCYMTVRHPEAFCRPNPRRLHGTLTALLQAEEKAAAKSELGFTAVPFCVVFDAAGAVCYQGDPAKIDFATVFEPPVPTDAVRPCVSERDGVG